MKNLRFDPFEIEIVPFPERVGAAMVKKCSPPIFFFRHDVGVGSRRAGVGPQKFCIDVVLRTVLQNMATQIVFADEACA